MARALHTIAVLNLVGACIVFGMCALRYLQNDQPCNAIDRRSAADIYVASGGSGGDFAGVETSPLVQQAKVFALYLQPVAVRQEERPPAAGPPLPEFRPSLSPPAASPTFTLCGTSYLQSQPQASMALLSIQSGQGAVRRWVKQGTQVGHFVIQEIRPGVIVYRKQGNGPCQEMRVDQGAPRPSLLQCYVPQVANANLAQTMEGIGSEPNGTSDGVP